MAIDHDKILATAAEALVEQKSWKAPYKVRRRPSSFPFCQLEYLFSILDPIEASVGDNFMGKIFVNMGSAAHETIQTYFGRVGFLYGRWQCKKCYHVSSPTLGTPYCGDKRHTWAQGKDLAGNNIGPDMPCQKGFALRYKEFKIKDPVSGLEGSCDGLLLVAGRLYLLEVKTKASSSVVRTLKVPDPPHVAQAGTYAMLCTPEEWGLDQKIEGIAFCYVPRDYPNKMRFMFHELAPEALENYRVDFPAVKNILKKGNIQEAKGICPNERYAKKMRYCEFAGQCFRPDRTAFLKKKRKELIVIKKAERRAKEEAGD